MNQNARDLYKKVPSGTPSIKAAILFVARATLRPALRQELKAAGIGEVLAPETLEACVAGLVHHDRALLVVDWDHGLETVNLVLKAAQGAFNVDTRPIFLLAPATSAEVVATGAEYGVARLHTGEVTKSALSEHLQALLDEESDDTGLRHELTRIADARRRGDWLAAGTLLAALQARFPDHRRVNCELVENLIHEEKWEQAAAIVDALSVTDGNNLRVRHLKARCLMKQGRFDAAANLLQECQLVNPFHVERLIDLGNALLQAARYGEARQSFDEALRLEQKSAAARQGQLQCRLVQGDVNDALKLMRELSGPRELAAVFNNAAILAIRHGRFEQGQSLYHTAIGTLGERERLTARLIFNLGLAYHKQGKGEEALSSFERACRIDPTFAAARTNATAYQAKLGKRPAGAGAPTKGLGKPTLTLDETFAGSFDEEKLKG
jgi:tetratricopeptide (TPR) repeat protein